MKRITPTLLWLTAAAFAVLLAPSSVYSAAGDLYVAEAAGTILRFTPDGTQSTFASGSMSRTDLPLTGRVIFLWPKERRA